MTSLPPDETGPVGVRPEPASDQPSEPRREKTEDRRAAIAIAARAIIAEKGLEGLRTRDIAARVGINIATLHYHVPSKEALIALVAESIRDIFRAQYHRRPRQCKTAREMLRMEFEDFAEILTETPSLLLVIGELNERARRDPAIAAIMSPMSQFWRDQLADLLRLGVADGSFRPDIDPVSGAVIITGALTQFSRFPHPAGAADALFSEIERAFARSEV
ncbi:TetR/AcrR family transcriptional regulator [Paracoccus aminophilus]|nr:TetR/AcrR family transcriptional regulator [Paracoccus aminophilus]